MPDNNVAAIVEAVLVGAITTREDFERRVSELDVEPNSPLAMDLHQASQYLDDADVRERDRGYAEDQRQQLSDIIARLRG